MDISPSLICTCLARLILKELEQRTGYWAYIFKEGSINFGSNSAPPDERIKTAVRGIQDLLLDNAGYSLKEQIKKDSTLSLDNFFDLLHLVGRLYLLDIKILNNKKEMKVIKLDQNMTLKKPLREAVFGLAN